jgi:DNA-binding transcriptional LysR family regulator
MPRLPQKRKRGAAIQVGIDLRGMILAIMVARSGSIRLAARDAELPASTVSRRLRALEEELGVSLFERRSSGVRPTAAGAEFLAAATRLLGGVRAAAERARNAGSAAIGKLIIGTYFSASKGCFRDLLMRFQRENRGLQVLLHEGRREELLAALRRGEVDAALVLGPANEPEVDQLSLWREAAMVAMVEDHPLADSTLVRWIELASETFLTTIAGAGPEARQKVEALLPSGHTARFTEHNVAQDTVLNLVGMGLGVSVLSESASGVSYPRVIFRAVGDDAGPTLMEAAAYWDPKRDNPPLRRFLALLRATQDPGSRDGGTG